jgi:hypothetical protein
LTSEELLRETRGLFGVRQDFLLFSVLGRQAMWFSSRRPGRTLGRGFLVPSRFDAGKTLSMLFQIQQPSAQFPTVSTAGRRIVRATGV